jgi:hypothetical protein
VNYRSGQAETQLVVLPGVRLPEAFSQRLLALVLALVAATIWQFFERGILLPLLPATVVCALPFALRTRDVVLTIDRTHGRVTIARGRSQRTVALSELEELAAIRTPLFVRSVLVLRSGEEITLSWAFRGVDDEAASRARSLLLEPLESAKELAS